MYIYIENFSAIPNFFTFPTTILISIIAVYTNVLLQSRMGDRFPYHADYQR